jgi:hexosaminidase
MKRALKILGWILGILLAIVAVAWFGFLKPKPPPISPEDRAELTIMPLPAELKLGSGEFVLDEALSHEFSGESGPRLERALSRFYTKLSQQTGMAFGSGVEQRIVLNCLQPETRYPSLEDDESYSIKVTSEKIEVVAPSGTGIIYALESLLQLAHEEEGRWVIPTLSLKDVPRYPWRGVMIDACRHWIPKEVILRNLEAMATLKMNVFHWHLTEYQGFRVESKVFPLLHELGSGGNHYTQDEIREVIEFAADRGIRVIPEFDLPGHSTSWFVGYPELASAPGPYVLDTIFGVLFPALDPTREEVYEFLDSFFGEMAELFPDEYLHIGGDEVNATHWNENQDIQGFMETRGLEDAHALQAHFNIRLQKLLEGHGKKMMGWDEIIHPDLPKEGIAVQTWRDHSSLWESARKGNKAVLSAGYYLDYKKPASYHYNVDPAVIQGAVNIEIDSSLWKGWECTMQLSEMEIDAGIYLFGEGDELRGIMNFMGGSSGFDDAVQEGNLLTFGFETNFGRIRFELEMSGDSIYGSGKIAVMSLNLSGRRSGGTDMAEGEPLPEFISIDPLTPEQEVNLLGGEACMWTEMSDGITIESRIWPRAASVAGKLWSPMVLSDDMEDMYRRLLVIDDLLEELGLKHRSYRLDILKEMVPQLYLEALQVLAEVLQEEEMFGRMAIYDPRLYTSTPMNRMVDAVAPESYQVYRFGEDVKLWLENEDAAAHARMKALLEVWSVNHEKLLPAFEGNDRLMEVEAQSRNLSVLAAMGLDALNDPAPLMETEAMQEEFFKAAAEAHGGTILPLVEPVQKLVESAAKK